MGKVAGDLADDEAVGGAAGTDEYQNAQRARLIRGKLPVAQQHGRCGQRKDRDGRAGGPEVFFHTREPPFCQVRRLLPRAEEHIVEKHTTKPDKKQPFFAPVPFATARAGRNTPRKTREAGGPASHKNGFILLFPQRFSRVLCSAHGR